MTPREGFSRDIPSATGTFFSVSVLRVFFKHNSAHWHAQLENSRSWTDWICLAWMTVFQSDETTGEKNWVIALAAWRIYSQLELMDVNNVDQKKKIPLHAWHRCHVALSPSSGSPVSVADKSGRVVTDGVSPTSSNHPGAYLLSKLRTTGLFFCFNRIVEDE